MSQVPSSVTEQPCPSCGLALDVAEEPFFSLVKCPRCRSEVHVRTRCGGWELLEYLGTGGSCRVFRARRAENSGDPNEGDFALKILEKRQPDYEESLSLLRNEARLAGLLRHPRVVKVFALESDETADFLVMECMSGGSLHDRIVGGEDLNERKILETGLEILKALSAAHAQGILHRDLKPANILFSASGGAKLADFGLALELSLSGQSGVKALSGGHLLATPDYVAPEILAGDSGDARSDLYGLGGCLYHALAGEPPFVTEGVTLEALADLKQHPPHIPIDAKKRLRPETIALVERLLSPDPQTRFANGAELEKSLLSVLGKLSKSRQRVTSLSCLLSDLRGILKRFP